MIYRVKCAKVTYKAVGGAEKSAHLDDLINDKGRGVDFSWLLEAGYLEEVAEPDAPDASEEDN
jgi:hypothetical protein